MGYFKIELIHKNGTKYYSEWQIEYNDVDSSKEEYINKITEHPVMNMTSIDIFDMEGNEISNDISYQDYEDFKKYLEWGNVLEIEMPHY